MELRQLRHFLTVIDCGSVGRAARQLRISQPALTKYIRSLERTLGAPLFTRSSDGMTLNEFGRTLEARARSIAIEVDRAEREIRELLGAERGRVMIGTSPSFALTVLLPHVLPSFRASHPHVQVVVVEGFLDTAASMIASGEMDFACGTLPLDISGGNLANEILLPNERIMVVAGSNHPLASRSRLTLAEIQPGPWALARGGGLRTRLNESFQIQGLPVPQPVFIYNSVSFAKELLRQGPCIGLLSASSVREEVEAGTLRILRVPDLVLERDVGLLSRTDPALSPSAKALLERVRAVTAEMRRRGRKR